MLKISERECFRPGAGRGVCAITVVLLAYFLCISSVSFADLSGSDVLVLVNANSPTSKYIAKMYRQYHPDVPESQILVLTDSNDFALTDCSGQLSTAADEIITRAEYNELIAEPVREYLLANNLVTQIKVIVTTAGIPYRIMDTNSNYANVILPGGSNPITVKNNETAISAASVESELTCLWYSDYGDNPFGLTNRMINPYQGYRTTGLDIFERLGPGGKAFTWTIAFSFAPYKSPRAEGVMVYPGVIDRNFNAGDIYLTCRLDGPKNKGLSAIFSVRHILERAKRASDPALGVNPYKAFAILDDAPDYAIDNVEANLDFNRVFNLAGDVDYLKYNEIGSNPPDARTIRNVDDYKKGFLASTGFLSDDDILNVGQTAEGAFIVLDSRCNNTVTLQSDLESVLYQVGGEEFSGAGVICYGTFGVNSVTNNSGDPIVGSDYLFTGGPGGAGPLNIVNGAVFTSLESFNAVTMFSDVEALYCAQGKIVDFISIGGAGAIGHAMEPQADGAIDNEFLVYNLLADEDGDGFADLTFVEAAFSAIPYLSWGEVVIGDPLMRLAYNTDGGNDDSAWFFDDVLGDVTRDGIFNSKDTRAIRKASGSSLFISDSNYDDMCDLTQDGLVNAKDLREMRKLY
jgi:hypothetical protein